MLPTRLPFRRQQTQEAIDLQQIGDTKEPSVEEQAVLDAVLASKPAEDAQHGVKNVEAVTLSWTKPSLVIVYVS
jgi:hypothetical protein